jgi:hypothetical protein
VDADLGGRVEHVAGSPTGQPAACPLPAATRRSRARLLTCPAVGTTSACRSRWSRFRSTANRPGRRD